MPAKMSRRYYRGSGGGKGTGKSKTPIGASPGNGPCLKCGKGHRTSDCPRDRESEKTLQADHLAEYTYFQEQAPQENVHVPPAEQQDYYNESFVANEHANHQDTGITTDDAIRLGKAIIDGGATRTMGSLHAVESLLTANQEKWGTNLVANIDPSERPTFGFGNSMKARSVSTCYMQVPSDKQRMKVRVHVIEEGRAPILLSVETLRNGAIIDYRHDTAIFTSLCPKTLVPLERSRLGHQLLPLGEDILSRGQPLGRSLCSLQQLTE